MTPPPSLTPAAIEAVCGRLETVERSDNWSGAVTTCWHRNPDGPEAATLIRALAARVEALEAGLKEAREWLSGWASADPYIGAIDHLLAGGGE